MSVPTSAPSFHSNGTSTPVDTTPTRPLRLVLVGQPEAGKSSLLGALVQSGLTQQGLLNGSLPALAEGLTQLRQSTYEGATPPTEQTLAAYPITYQPRDGSTLTRAVLLDCDGRIVSDLLGKISLERGRRGSLGRAVLDADALLLTVDASANEDELNQQFETFGSFLHSLESGRGKRTDASGLPVLLVLTKCDLLADGGDSFVDWMDAIEQRKTDVDAGFRDFLARQGASTGQIPFGRIDLHIWATAVKRPALRRMPGKPREPFGVAELFRQTLEEAEAYRRRKDQSGRRLFWISTSAALLVSLMLSATVGLGVYNQSRPLSPLERRVEQFRSQEAETAAARLRTSTTNLRARLDQLRQIETDPVFAQLPEGDRSYVQSRTREISDYLDYYAKIQALRRPADMTSEKEMQQLRAHLDGDCKPRPEWTETVAGSIYNELSRELEILHNAVTTLQHWFRDNGDLFRSLWAFEDNRAPGLSWSDEVTQALEQTRQLPYSEQGNLPGSTTLTSATALAFLPVVRERDYFERVRRQLEGERDLLAALGLLGRVSEPPILVISKTFKLGESTELLDRLRKNYPGYEKEFDLERMPAAIRPNIMQAARSSYQALLPPARELVLKKLQQAGERTTETLDRWNSVREWLQNPTELKDWRTLATLLARLHDHSEPLDPVRDLATFLARQSFEISPAELTLITPESYNSRMPSNAELTITQSRGGEELARLVYQRAERRTSRDPESRGYRYVFVLSKGERIVFQPGDTIRATLKLKEDEMLSWINQRSDLYQFERLSLPPRRLRVGQEEEKGEEEPRVQLRAAEGAIPRVPDLLPQVRLP